MTTLSTELKLFFFVLGAVVGAGKIASYLSSKVWQVAFKSFSLTTSQPYSWLSRQRVTHSDNFPICFSSDENFCGSVAVAVKADADLAARSSLAITMLSHVVQCCTKLNNAIVCYTMMYKTKQCYSMLYNAIRCYTMLYHDIPCYTVLCNTLSCCIILGMSMRQNLLEFSNAIHILFSFRALIWVKRRCDLLSLKARTPSGLPWHCPPLPPFFRKMIKWH